MCARQAAACDGWASATQRPRVQALHSILANAQHHKKSIVKEACWTVSNITAGTKEQINAVIESGCVVPIVHLLTHGEIEIKREAAWAISNATSAGDLNQIQHLVQYGCVPPLCQLLRAMDQRVVQVCRPPRASSHPGHACQPVQRPPAFPSTHEETCWYIITSEPRGCRWRSRG